MNHPSLLPLTIAATLLFAACGSDATTSTSTETTSTTTTTEASAEPALDALDVEYGCGYGFYVSDADQTVGLIVSTNRPDVPAVSDLVADGIWTAEVRIGEDLFANWCDDVIEEGEPEPVVTDRWSVGAGTISIGEVPAECSGAPVTATLSDMVVLTSDGERIELDEFDVTNSAWGCFAG